jgi:hypothetical protein
MQPSPVKPMPKDWRNPKLVIPPHGGSNAYWGIRPAYAGKYPVQLYCLREKSSLEGGYDALGTEKIYSGDALKELQQKYPNPLMSPEFVELARSVGGHGGMDFIMDYRLVYCLHNGLPLDMDVYDLAEWCCVSDLSRLSLENGNRPVEVPDFTRGEWDVLNGFSYASVE